MATWQQHCLRYHLSLCHWAIGTRGMSNVWEWFSLILYNTVTMFRGSIEKLPSFILNGSRWASITRYGSRLVYFAVEFAQLQNIYSQKKSSDFYNISSVYLFHFNLQNHWERTAGNEIILINPAYIKYFIQFYHFLWSFFIFYSKPAVKRKNCSWNKKYTAPRIYSVSIKRSKKETHINVESVKTKLWGSYKKVGIYNLVSKCALLCAFMRAIKIWYFAKDKKKNKFCHEIVSQLTLRAREGWKFAQVLSASLKRGQATHLRGE